MCSIGALFANKRVYVYKQCDLTVEKKFNEPDIRVQKLKYLAMTREGRPGLWAGVNVAGVCFVAADAYTNRTYEVPDNAINELFIAYERSIANATTARESVDILEHFYRIGYKESLFPGPDIALFADPTNAIFIEFTPGPNNHDPIREIVIDRDFFASTNHFRVQPDAVIYEANHSTYLRLARAETILEKDPSCNGIMTLLKDRYYGKSELSICRTAQYPGEYFTQATVLFSPEVGTLCCEYQINGNPNDHELMPWPSKPN